MFHACVILVYIIFSGATLRACVLQCLHNPVVRPAADLSRWPHGCDARTPAARSPHYAQYAVQASDQLWQRRVWLHGDAAAGPATVTPQGLRAQPQKTSQLWGRMRVSGFPSAKKKKKRLSLWNNVLAAVVFKTNFLSCVLYHKCARTWDAEGVWSHWFIQHFGLPSLDLDFVDILNFFHQ